ncbi:ATP-binding protein [Methanosarcina sp. Mfa9]|uniref:ATP-binding protein n=1 Tax=Methanosarcina sp. Mfa9 TaxID=3439063 RepID=UPI003F82BA04
MQKSELRRIILSRQAFFQKHQALIPHDRKIDLYLEDSEVVMICGIRGCGKTSLLKQIADRLDGIKIYINFEIIKPEDFEPRNFQDIRDIAAELYESSGKELDQKEIEEGGEKQVYYFLEEIQHIPLWESWLKKLYEDGIKVFVTGSNSKFLNSGNGPFLTGRSKPLRLFPFSFKEYLRLKGIEMSDTDLDSLPTSRKDEILSHFLKYFDNGGFPQVIKNEDFELSRDYFEEVLQKEILDRHEFPDGGGLRRLAVFLFSNVASEYSFETLKKVSGIESEDTVRLYLDYLEESFLLYRVPGLNHSQDNSETQDNSEIGSRNRNLDLNWKEKVMAASCKVYAGDTGFFKTVATNYPDSLGLRFENLVFLELLRRGKELFFFRDRRECDFVVKRDVGQGQEIMEAIQVSTYFGNPAVREREVEGLLGAMQKFGLEEGLILTLDEEEVLIPGDEGSLKPGDEDIPGINLGSRAGEKGKKIAVKPVWKWLLE